MDEVSQLHLKVLVCLEFLESFKQFVRLVKKSDASYVFVFNLLVGLNDLPACFCFEAGFWAKFLKARRGTDI